MSGNDYVKFMTQEIVRYMDLPEEERKKRKAMKKQQETISTKWFGLIPYALKFLFKRKQL